MGIFILPEVHPYYSEMNNSFILKPFLGKRLVNEQGLIRAKENLSF